MTPESRFKKQAMGAIKGINGSWFFSKEAAAIRGIPDVIGLINGRFVALEFKKNTAEANKKTGRVVQQKYNIEIIRRNGGYGAIITPENFHEIYEELIKISRQNNFQQNLDTSKERPLDCHKL